MLCTGELNQGELQYDLSLIFVFLFFFSFRSIFLSAKCRLPPYFIILFFAFSFLDVALHALFFCVAVASICEFGEIIIFIFLN
jgi:hypothetical protein